MRMLKILLCGLLMTLPVFAEEADDRQTATSLHYVSHELDTRQNKLSAGSNKALTYTNSAGNVEQRTVKANLNGGTTDTSLPMVNAVNAGLDSKQDDISTINDHTAVTYTGQTGTIGAKGIYQDSGTYVEQSDNLIDAKTFNAALKNGLDSEFICAEYKPGTDLCWLWQIHNTTTDNTLLPPGYTPVEYIEGTGTQFINTGRALDGSDTVEFKYSHFTPQHSDNMLAGDYGGNTSFALNLMNYRLYFYYKSPVGVPIMAINDFDEPHIIRVSDGTLFVDDVFKYRTDKTNDFTTAHDAQVFRASSFTSAMRVYYYRVVDHSGNILQNLVPARRNNDNVLGMYDTVGGNFLTNAGTGTFTAGHIIYLPQGQ